MARFIYVMSMTTRNLGRIKRRVLRVVVFVVWLRPENRAQIRVRNRVPGGRRGVSGHSLGKDQGVVAGGVSGAGAGVVGSADGAGVGSGAGVGAGAGSVAAGGGAVDVVSGAGDKAV